MRILGFLMLILVAQSGCVTTPKSCRGLATQQVVLEPHGSSVHLRTIEIPGEDPIVRLRCDVDRGDRVAMLKLGMRYETGAGVAADIERAAQLYRQASADVSPHSAIYSPPVKLGGAGQVMLIPNADAGPGLAAAKFRLGRLYLEGRGVEQNEEKGRSLIESAASLGDADAKAFLDDRG